MEMQTFKISEKDLEQRLLKDYINALKNEDFKKLVVRLKVPEDVAKKYTSKLERTCQELNNCAHCRALEQCQNPISGCIYYPEVENDALRFNYVACKYKKEALEKEKNSASCFEEPIAIRSASFAGIDMTDKKRSKVIKWINTFYRNYAKGAKMKGLYLHGNFGSGKTYLLAALFNELAKKGVKTTIIYYPEMLRLLKSSFADDYEEKMTLLKNSDLLLIDDIGAENVSAWSRDEILGSILQYRMDAELPTFFSSNLNIEELAIHLSETKNAIDELKARRIIERIKQLTEDFELISDNRRK